MDYPNKTLTRDGAALLAGDDADGNPTIIDKIAVSNKMVSNTNELDTLHIQDFANVINFPVDAYKHNGSTFQAESTFDNSNVPKSLNKANQYLSPEDDGEHLQLSQDYQIMMIGLLGHEGNVDDADETLIAVSLVDLDNPSPYEMPKVSSVPFTFTMAMNLTYSNAQNVKAIISPAGSVTQSDLNNTLKLYISTNKAMQTFETQKSASAAHQSLSAAVDSLNSNVGSDVSTDLKSIEDEVTQLRGKPATQPSIVGNMNVTTGILSYSITQPKWNGGTDIQSYQVFYKLDSDNDYKEFNVDADDLTGQIKNLNPNRHYNMYVIAGNAYGNSPKSAVITTSIGNPPDAPTLQAKMDTQHSMIDYGISSPTNHGSTDISKYTLYYCWHGHTDYTPTDVTNLSGTIGGVNPKQKYDLFVTATNEAGESKRSNMVTTDIIDSTVYGVHWNRTSDVHLDRTDGAIGLVSGINGQRDDFDNRGPWQLMHKVTDDKGNVFVRMHKFYIYKEQDGSENNGNLYIKVSLVDHGQGWYLPNCFWDFENHQELPYVDVGAYDATINNSQLQSITGATPTVNTSMDTFRQDARNTGYGYGLLDIHTVDAITCLFLVEFATLDSKSIMEGKDESNGGSMVNNGVTDNHRGSSGTDSGNRNGTMNYRGIENLWGNVWQWIDGVNLNGGPIWICDDQSQYQSNVYANPYKQLDYNTVNGDMSSIGLDVNNPEANFATAVNGSPSTYFCDGCDVDDSGYVPYFGGSCNYSADHVGLFDWSDGASSGSGGVIGSRLIKKDIG